MADLDLLNFELEPIDELWSFSDTTGCSSPKFPQKRPCEQTNEEELCKDTLEFKKARKRRQNRESAARSRARKKQEFDLLEQKLAEMASLNKQLALENSALKAENSVLKKELEFYHGVVNSEDTKMRGSPRNTGFLAVSVVLSVICVVVVTQPEDHSSPSMGNRKLHFLNTEERTSFSYLLVGLMAVISLTCAWKYLRG